MFINDIEFIDPLSQKDLKSDLTITGGASAVAKTYTSADESGVSAKGYAKAKGKKSSSIAKTNVKFNVKKGKNGKVYISGYSAAYGSAYGADHDGYALDKDLSTSVFH